MLPIHLGPDPCALKTKGFKARDLIIMNLCIDLYQDTTVLCAQKVGLVVGGEGICLYVWKELGVASGNGRVRPFESGP